MWTDHRVSEEMPLGGVPGNSVGLDTAVAVRWGRNGPGLDMRAELGRRVGLGSRAEEDLRVGLWLRAAEQ